MIRLAALALLSTSACFFHPSDKGSDDIVGPFTGARTRYVVDRLALPMNNAEARVFGTDLDGDNIADNQLGQVIATLISADSNDRYIADRIAGGELQMVVEIQADDLQNDDRVGVWVYGFDDTDVRPVGGALVNGTFIPNFIRDSAAENTGSATIPMPILADADTSRADVPYMQISLVPDGAGGYDAQIHGAVRMALETANLAIEQQLREQPELHRWMWTLMDANHNGLVEGDEWNNSLLLSLLAPDIEIEGEDLLSFGIGFHLVSCSSGNCALSTPVNACHDRVRGGDEVDVDCGGSCGPCGAGLACDSGDDCQAGTCNTTNTCAVPTCFDGIKNGFEASTDCGGACAKKCEIGQVCGLDLDCEFRCSAPPSDTGVCQR